MALVTRIEVLNQHECQTGIVRQMAQQLRERLQAAGGSAYAHNVGGSAADEFAGGLFDGRRGVWRPRRTR
jgi:hypothetical protein